MSAAAAASLPQRWVWPAVLGAAAVCTAVVAADGLLGDVFILPVMCLLTAFALQGTRHLVSVNAELVEARDELTRNAVAQERLRFARDLHDLLGHSLSLIALKSELAGRLAETDPARARAEMADVEAAARRALAEVRDAVSGYRQVSLAQALVEARVGAVRRRDHAALPGRWASRCPPRWTPSSAGWSGRRSPTCCGTAARGSVTVELATGADDVTLTVSDDGHGTTARSAGAGLAGLAERVEALGGRLATGAGRGVGLPAHRRRPADVAGRQDRCGSR